MLDRFPHPAEVAAAENDFQMGHATCEQIEILRFAHPERNYDGCDCVGEFFEGIFNPTWPF